MLKRLLPLVPVLLWLGCEREPPANPMIDGKLLFRALGEGSALEVELYGTPRAAPAAIVRGDGHCDVHPVGSADNFVNGIFLDSPTDDVDLGTTIVATDGVVTFTATGSAPASHQYEGALATSERRFDSTWTLTNSGAAGGLEGGTLATLHTPDAVGGVSFDPIDTTKGPVTVTYTGGAGAESFHIEIQGKQAIVDCYPPAGSNSFTLPVSVGSFLDPMIMPLIWAETVSYVRIGDRRVLQWVTSDNLD